MILLRIEISHSFYVYERERQRTRILGGVQALAQAHAQGVPNAFCEYESVASAFSFYQCSDRSTELMVINLEFGQKK